MECVIKNILQLLKYLNGKKKVKVNEYKCYVLLCLSNIFYGFKLVVIFLCRVKLKINGEEQDDFYLKFSFLEFYELLCYLLVE